MSTSSLLRSLGLGKLALHLYHNPVGRLRDSIRAGGPLQQRRTERGRRQMEQAAHQLLPLPAPAKPAPPLELHLLTGRRFWYQTAFCLWSFGQQADRVLAPVIYDDGTLEEGQRTTLSRLFPTARFIATSEILQRLDTHLPASRFPFLRERRENYPNIRKLIDVHVGQVGWKLVLDSDLLFFRRPSLLIKWLDKPAVPLHAVDIATSYGYARDRLNALAGAPLDDLVNVGLCGLNGAELDWEKLESWCQTLIAGEGTNYYLEQALVAALVAGRPCTIAPAHDYVTLPKMPEARECRAVMHHYVAESKRWYFQHNWFHALANPPVR